VKNKHCDLCKFTPEFAQFIRENYIGRSNQELADEYNVIYRTYYTREQVNNYKSRSKLNSGITGRFKKGHIPKNHLPVGSEIVTYDGYTRCKVAEPNLWRAKHHILYEKYHGIKIPNDKIVIFLDENRSNFDCDNLALITRDENRILNYNHLRFNDKDLTKTGLSIAKLKAAIYKKEREN